MVTNESPAGEFLPLMSNTTAQLILWSCYILGYDSCEVLSLVCSFATVNHTPMDVKVLQPVNHNQIKMIKQIGRVAKEKTNYFRVIQNDHTNFCSNQTKKNFQLV